jgi:hypothetical protein
MTLKVITLIAALTQLLTVFCSVFSTARYAAKLKWADNAEWFVMQPIYLLAHVVLVIFLFVLFARQKST